MGADVAEASGSGYARIVSPYLLLAFRFEWIQQPALRVFGDDLENFA